MTKDYDYLLKVLLVGDSDVGKHEILSGLEDASSESPFCSGNGKNIKHNFSQTLANDALKFVKLTRPQQFYWKASELNFSYGTHQVKAGFVP